MTSTLLQLGIYTVSEAARLTDVSPWRIRRWLRGYEFKSKIGRHHSQPVWNGQLQPIDHSMAIGFLDLIEIRYVNAFIREGVSWKTLRLAHKRSQQALNVTHPFCTNQFKVAGRDIILEIPQDFAEPQLWEIAKDQRVFGRIIHSYIRDLEFADGGVPARWWPLGKSHHVVLDPCRNFGQPIVSEEGVPTSVLARSVAANGSAEEVASWFEISVRSVEEAIEFEKRIAA